MRTNPANRDKALLEYLVKKYGTQEVKDAVFSIMSNINKTKNNSNK